MTFFPANVSVSAASVYLCVAVIRFLQLQVFSRLAGKIHPLPLEPFDGGFLQQRFCIYFSHKRDVFTCTKEDMCFNTLPF